MGENGFSYEIVFVDDGSSDGSWEAVCRLKVRDPHVRGIRFRRNYGKSAALYCGFEAARGEVVITMDADLQDSPDEIPELYRMVAEQGYDLVSGWKKKRYDPLGKTLPSKFFNATARLASGIRLHDFNWRPEGIPAEGRQKHRGIRRDAPFHTGTGQAGRFPADRREGRPSSGPQVRGFQVRLGADDQGVSGSDYRHVHDPFRQEPMYFFGGLGTLMFLLGGATAVYLIAEKLYKQAHGLLVRA